MVVRFLWMTYGKYEHVDAAAYGMFWSRRDWLWVHLAGGTVGMLLGFTQFLTRLRVRHPVVHRWTGRIYLLAMLVACIGATGLIATSPAGLGIRVAFAATGLAWLVAALMGFVAIRRKRIQAHRRWMVRAYIVNFAPILFRTLILVPGVMTLASPVLMIPTLLWLSWAAPIILFDLGSIALRAVRGSERTALAY